MIWLKIQTNKQIPNVKNLQVYSFSYLISGIPIYYQQHIHNHTSLVIRYQVFLSNTNNVYTIIPLQLYIKRFYLKPIYKWSYHFINVVSSILTKYQQFTNDHTTSVIRYQVFLCNTNNIYTHSYSFSYMASSIPI